MIAQRRATHAGVDTRELYVTGAGPTIVLLHGFADSADTWRPVLALLKRAGRHAVAVDLIGSGDADLAQGCPLLSQLDEFVGAVVAHHGAESAVVLAGNSLGGLLAARAAASAKRLPICGIVLCGPWHAADPATVDHFAKSTRIRRETGRLVATVRRTVKEVDAIDDVAEIDCPTVVLHGCRDRLVSIAAARRLHHAITGSRLALLPHSGHCPQLDAPERVAALSIELATAATPRHAGTA